MFVDRWDCCFKFVDRWDCYLSEVFFCYIFVAGLVERVVLLGAPVSIKDENWEEARKVVGCVCDFLIGSLYKLFYTAVFFQEVGSGPLY